MDILPSAANTVPNTAQILVNPLWAQPHQLGEIFGMSRTTVWRFITEMEARKEYKKASISLNKRLKLINIKVFEQFLLAQHNQWLNSEHHAG